MSPNGIGFEPETGSGGLELHFGSRFGGIEATVKSIFYIGSVPTLCMA